MARLVQLDLTCLLVDREVTFLSNDALFLFNVLFEQRNQLVDLLIELGAVFGLAGDDQWRAGFVDEDRVDLVDNREIEFALVLFFQAECHVVAQVVEAELVVRTVCDISRVRCALLFRRLERCNDTHCQTQEFIQRTHPVGIATRQVIVHRNNMNTFASECVEVYGQGRNQRLAFTGTHFGNFAFVKRHAADQLHVEVTHPHNAFAGFAADGKGFGKNLIKGLALAEAGLELFGLAPQLLVGERQHLLFERIDGLNRLEHALDLTLILATKELLH